MSTDFEAIFLFDFGFHIIRFLPKAYRMEISDGKSHRMTAPARTTIPQQPVILKKKLNFVLKKGAHYFYSYCQEKN
jgi:hypothetical protein